MISEEKVVQAFAELAEALVADYDVVDLLQMLVESCRDVLEIADVGIVLVGEGGVLELVASTSESSGLVETFQLAVEAGPAVDTLKRGELVSVPDLRARDGDEAFRKRALELGYLAVHAIPMRLRDTPIGSLSLLGTEPGDLAELDLLTAQAMADVATVGILHERALRESAVLVRQLQGALDSRTVIEQAKGVIAHTQGISVDAAFDVIRSYARSERAGLSDVARRIVHEGLRLPTQNR